MINETKLSLAQIHEKIMDDTFAELTVFPNNPSVKLCLEYGDTLLKLALQTFPNIHKCRPYPDTFAILMVMLLYSTDRDLYNECTTLTDIMDKLRFSSTIDYGVDINCEIRLEVNHQKCTCSHWIDIVYMCNANTNFFILGSTCIDKTNIVSLIEKRKNLEKRTCEICGEFRNPANQNIDICVPCSKKIYCNYCNEHKRPSKQNPELCTKCCKDFVKCATKSCNTYISNKYVYCSKCKLAYETERRQIIIEELRKQEEERRLKRLELEKNIKKIKCETCPAIMEDPPLWKKQCITCYKQKKTYIEERQKINSQKKQEALKLQKEISDLNT
jgi:hypothetical protein